MKRKEIIVAQMTPEWVNIKIDDYLKQKAQGLADIDKKISECITQREECDKRMTSAADSADFAEYEKAKADEASAASKLAMYRTQKERLKDNSFVPESESDHVIDCLIEYMEKTHGDFEREIKDLIPPIEALYNQYMEKIHEARDAMTRWQNEIRPNYRTFGHVASKTATGEITDRLSYPVPVERFVDLSTCPESGAAHDFITRSRNYLKEE